MKSEINIDRFQFEGPSGFECHQIENALRCEWTPIEALWSLGKTNFCYAAVMSDS